MGRSIYKYIRTYYYGYYAQFSYNYEHVWAAQFVVDFMITIIACYGDFKLEKFMSSIFQIISNKIFAFQNEDATKNEDDPNMKINIDKIELPQNQLRLGLLS